MNRDYLLLIFIIFNIFITSNLFGMNIKRDSNQDFMMVDINNDSKVDLVLKYKNKTLMHYYLDHNGVETNISVVKNYKSYVKEFSKKKNKIWKIYKREKMLFVNSKYSKRIIETINNQKVDTFETIVENIQLERGLESFLHRPQYTGGVFSSGESINDEILKSSGDCLTLEIMNQGEFIDLSTVLTQNIDFTEFIDFEDCGNVCPAGQQSLTCKDGYSETCPIYMKNVLSESIQDSLDCMYSMNQDLAAQLSGLILSNRLGAVNPDQCNFADESFDAVPNEHCKKVTVSCFQNTDVIDYHGSATNTCDTNWPKIEINNIGCDSKKSIPKESVEQTLLHEMIHLLGYSHGEKPELAYACTLACGGILGRNSGDNKTRFHENINNQSINFAHQSSISAAVNICQENNATVPDYDSNIELVMSQYRKLGLISTHNSWSLSPNYFEDTNRVMNFYLQDENIQFNQNQQFCDDVTYGSIRNCNDNAGTYRTVYFEKIMKDENPTVLINTLMFADQNSRIYQNLTEFMESESRPSYIERTIPAEYGKFKGGSLGLANRLKFIGEQYKSGDYHNTLEKLLRVKNQLPSSFLTNPRTDNAISEGLKGAIDIILEKFCIKHIRDLQIQEQTNASNPTKSVDSCQQFL